MALPPLDHGPGGAALQAPPKRDRGCMNSAFGGADGFARVKARNYADVIAARR